MRKGGAIGGWKFPRRNFEAPASFHRRHFRIAFRSTSWGREAAELALRTRIEILFGHGTHRKTVYSQKSRSGKAKSRYGPLDRKHFLARL